MGNALRPGFGSVNEIKIFALYSYGFKFEEKKYRIK